MILMCFRELKTLLIFTFMTMFIFMIQMSVLNMEPQVSTGHKSSSSLLWSLQGVNEYERLFLANFLTLNGNL